jgi:hypothetical protein
LPAAGLTWLATALPAAADLAGAAAGWRADPDFSVSATTNFVLSDGGSASFNTLAAGAGLSFETPDSPWAGGLFASYQLSRQEPADDVLSAGAYANLDRGPWRLSAWLAAVGMDGSPELWLAGSGIRYEFVRAGKLGLELMTPVDALDGLRLAFTWSGSLGEQLTLKLMAGTDTDSDVDVTATLEWSWDIF